MIQTLFRLLRPALSQPGLKLQDFEKHQTDAQNWENMFGLSESNGMDENMFQLQFETLVCATSNLRTLNEGCDDMIWYDPY